MQDKKFGNGISVRFKAFRKEQKLTQSQLARSLSVKQSTVSKIERGSKQLDQNIMRSLVEIFHININWILTGIGEKYISEDSTTQDLDPDPEIASLMEGARRVLTSGNPIAFDALERNIRYFDHAIAAEKRADESERKIRKMEEDMEFIKQEFHKLKLENQRLDEEEEVPSSNKKVA